MKAGSKTRRMGPRLSLLACALWGVTGCAGSSDLAKTVDGLRSELITVRAQNGAIKERLDALERAAARSPAPGGVAAHDPAALEANADEGKPTALRVVTLSPEVTEPPPEATAPEPAPRAVHPSSTAAAEAAGPVTIRSTKDGLVREDPAREKSDAAGALEFKRAKELYDRRSFDKAQTAFAAFVNGFPEHPKLAEGTYFRGMAYAAKGNPQVAAQHLDQVAMSFPRSTVAPDALYELAKLRDKLGERDAADRARAKLKTEFPKSAAAKKLEKR